MQSTFLMSVFLWLGIKMYRFDTKNFGDWRNRYSTYIHWFVIYRKSTQLFIFYFFIFVLFSIVATVITRPEDTRTLPTLSSLTLSPTAATSASSSTNSGESTTTSETKPVNGVSVPGLGVVGARLVALFAVLFALFLIVRESIKFALFAKSIFVFFSVFVFFGFVGLHCSNGVCCSFTSLPQTAWNRARSSTFCVLLLKWNSL